MYVLLLYCNRFHKYVQLLFVHKPIEFVSNVQLLRINISKDIYDMHTSDTVRHCCYCHTNTVVFDFFCNS